MANTLNNLIPDIYTAVDVISRELIGFIPSVTRDTRIGRAAVGQTVRIPISTAAGATDITPAVTPPNDGDQTITNNQITISRARRVPVRWNGEETIGVNSGPGYSNLLVDEFSQAMRTLTNEIEADIAALYTKASRAWGTPGTAPFAVSGNYSDAAQAYKLSVDNGAPISSLQLVINTTAGANIRGKQAQVYMSGDSALLRQGVIQDINGLSIRESAQIKNAVKGTGAGYTTTTAGFAVGTMAIPLITGSGTIVAGDVITFAGDTNKYVVTTGIAAPGTLTIAAPGLRQAIPAAATAVTVGNSYTANMAFAKGAILLAARAPAKPEGGDMADDQIMITDPKSGLTFEVSLYRQYRQIQYEVAMAWGVACIKPEHVVLLQG